MLKRLLKVQHLARFENPSSCAGCEFLQLNVIYANNGRGKSTLAAIFRSVSENSPNHLLARQTLGQVNKPVAELLFNTVSGGNQIAKFDGSTWSQSPEQILVFDQEFIDQNVFIGGRVDYVQKRGLYEVFVGHQTGSLVSQIAAEDEEIRKLNPRLSALTDQIAGIKKSNISLDEFLSLKKIDPADNPIPELESQVEARQNKSKVVQFAGQEKITYIAPDFSKLESMLNTSVKTISEATAVAVKSHVAALGSHDAETWLDRGHELREHTDGKCPYCGQSLGPSDLADHFEEYFNKEYTAALTVLRESRIALIASLGDGPLVTFGEVIAQNNKVYDYWKQFSIEGLDETNFELDKLQADLVSASKLTNEVLNSKLQDPLTVIEVPKQLNDIVDSLNAKIEELKSYNESIHSNNELIAKFKADLMKADDTAEVTNNLNYAYDRRSRHTTAVDKICGDYLDADKAKKAHEKAKQELRKTLDSSSVRLIEQHLVAINDCLKKSGASFSLKRIDHSHIGGKPNSTFVIDLNGEEVQSDESSSDKPTLKTALSSGDKTTLAFAFFASYADQDPNIANSIVVIDDPISSLDYSRRWHTINTIFGLFSKSTQGILLSHDPDFLHGTWTKAGATSMSRASFKVIRDGRRASKIEAWDVEKQAESDQKNRILRIESFIDNGLASGDSLAGVASAIRPSMEHAYKAIYPKEFPSSGTLGAFIGTVETSTEPYLTNIQARIDRVRVVNDYITPYSSHDGGSNLPSIDETELVTHAQEALELLRS